MNKSNTEEVSLNEEMKQLVIARIEAQVASNLRLSIGSSGSLSKEEMISHIKSGDEIGKRIVESHLRFLRAQISGQVTRALISIE